MSVLMITYAHKNPQTDYAQFFEALKGNADHWWHYIDSTWIVATHYSPDEFANILYPHINPDDRLLVVKITSEQQGWLPVEAWKWLTDRIY